MWSNQKTQGTRKIYLPNHLFNQWYNLCSPNNGDAPNIRFDKNNKGLIQGDSASFCVLFQPFHIIARFIMRPSTHRRAWKGE